MRVPSFALFITTCVSIAGSTHGRSAEPPKFVPTSVPQATPSGHFSSFPANSGSAPITSHDIIHDDCPPPANCLPNCTVPCRPGLAPRVRVIMSPPEVVFQNAPSCASSWGFRRCLPNCFTGGAHSCFDGGCGGSQGVPQGVPSNPRPQVATPQGTTGQPQATAQQFQTVPVTTFHAVPVTTYQTVPVTTFQTVPVTGAATFGVQSFGAQAFGAQAYGAQGFGVQPFGFGGVAPAGFGGFGAPMGFGAQAANGDFEMRLMQALSVIANQNKANANAQAQGENKPCNKGAGAQAQGADSQDEVTKQFLALEKRLQALTGEVTYNREWLRDHEERIKKLEEAEDARKRMTPPVAPPALPAIPVPPVKK